MRDSVPAIILRITYPETAGGDLRQDIKTVAFS